MDEFTQSRSPETMPLQRCCCKSASADLYASCLLMPRKLVMHAWRERFGNDHPRVLRRKDRIVVPGDTEDEIVTAFLRRP